MCLNQLLQRPVKDELGNCRSLRAPLKNSSLIVRGIFTDSFRLDCSWASVKIKGQLQVQHWVLQDASWLDDVVQIHSVIET